MQQYTVEEPTTPAAIERGFEVLASNNFWFSVNYYLGFEDDYDAGR